VHGGPKHDGLRIEEVIADEDQLFDLLRDDLRDASGHVMSVGFEAICPSFIGGVIDSYRDAISKSALSEPTEDMSIGRVASEPILVHSTGSRNLCGVFCPHAQDVQIGPTAEQVQQKMLHFYEKNTGKRKVTDECNCKLLQGLTANRARTTNGSIA